MNERNKIAVIFPGIGYHCDKPLLYYAKKIAKVCGYEIKEVPYNKFPSKVLGSKEKMKESFEIAMEQAEEILKDTNLKSYENILFIAKSVGTVVAGAYADKHDIDAKLLIYTPVEETFNYLKSISGIVFHGTNDPWVETEIVKKNCDRMKLPLHIISEANHSLEVGNPNIDIMYLHEVMRISQEYIEQL